MVCVDRVPTAIERRRDISARIPKLMRGRNVVGAVIASVAPRVNIIWQSVLERCCEKGRVIWLNHKAKLGIPLTYPRPETLGADRLANACAAAALYGAPVIVADFGTAVTFDVITAKDGFIGGIIAPGIPLMFSYLSEKTALLPGIQPGPVRNMVGKNTHEAVRLGALWGYSGLVKSILGNLKTGLKGQKVKVCATGGYATWVLKGAGLRIPVDPLLTLKGLGRIFELNAV